jgi:hypothetical protein
MIRSDSGILLPFYKWIKHIPFVFKIFFRGILKNLLEISMELHEDSSIGWILRDFPVKIPWIWTFFNWVTLISRLIIILESSINYKSSKSVHFSPNIFLVLFIRHQFRDERRYKLYVSMQSYTVFRILNWSCVDFDILKIMLNECF